MYMSKASRTIRQAITPILNSTSVYEAKVVDAAEQHILLAQGALVKPDAHQSGDLLIDGKPFLFDQIVKVEIDQNLVFYFGFPETLGGL